MMRILILVVCALLSNVFAIRELNLLPYLHNAGAGKLDVPPGFEYGAPIDDRFVPRIEFHNEYDVAKRTAVAVLTDDTWVTDAPMQFRTTSLSFGRGTDRHEAPYGFFSLLESERELFKIFFHNSTTAILQFNYEPMFDAHNDEERVVMAIDEALVASKHSIGPADLIFLPDRSNEADEVWTAFFFLAVILLGFSDPFSVCDVQVLAFAMSHQCSRVAISNLASATLRTYALPCWYEQPPATALFLCCFILLLLQLTVMTVQWSYFAKGDRYVMRFGYHFAFFTAFFFGPSVATWRMLFYVYGVEYVFLGLLGFAIYVLAPLPLLSLWKLKAGKGARYYHYSWYPTQPMMERFLWPEGFWGPARFIINYKLMLMNVSKRGMGIIILPFWVAGGAAMVLAAQPQSGAGCSSLSILLVWWYVLAAFFIAVMRPYRSIFLNVTSIGSYLAIALVCVGLAMQAVNDSQAAVVLTILGAVLCLGFLILRGLFLWLLNFFEPSWKEQMLLLRE